MGALRTAAGETTLLAESGEEVAPNGRRQLRKGMVRPVQGLTNNCLDHGPQGQAGDLQQLWPVGSPCRRGADPQGSPCWHGDKSRWQRELRLAFEELSTINRELKRHLSLHLKSGPGAAQSPSEDPGFSETPRPLRAAPRRERTAVDADMDVAPAGDTLRPAEVAARRTSPRTDPQALRSEPENLECRGVVQPPFGNGSQLSSPEAGAGLSDRSVVLGGLASGHEGLVSLPCHLPGQADGAGAMASELQPKVEAEQRSLMQLQLLEGAKRPAVATGAHGQTEEEEARRVQLVGLMASFIRHLEGLRLGRRERCEPLPALPWTAGVPEDKDDTDSDSDTHDDDTGHRQMARDLRQQISEQNKSTP